MQSVAAAPWRAALAPHQHAACRSRRAAMARTTATTISAIGRRAALLGTTSVLPALALLGPQRADAANVATALLPLADLPMVRLRLPKGGVGRDYCAIKLVIKNQGELHRSRNFPSWQQTPPKDAKLTHALAHAHARLQHRALRVHAGQVRGVRWHCMLRTCACNAPRLNSACAHAAARSGLTAELITPELRAHLGIRPSGRKVSGLGAGGAAAAGDLVRACTRLCALTWPGSQAALQPGAACPRAQRQARACR